MSVVWKARVQSSGVRDRNDPAAGPPALATRMSILPRDSKARETSCPTSSGLVRSARTESTRAEVEDRIVSAAASIRSVREHTTTSAPSSANSLAAAKPSPLEDPSLWPLFPSVPGPSSHLARKAGLLLHADDGGTDGPSALSPHASPPEPLSADSSRYHERPWRRGGGRYGGWGELCPPIPQEFPPLPLPNSRGRESQPQQGEPLAPLGIQARARGGGSRGIRLFAQP